VVVARALRLQPEGERSPEAATCAFCGLHIGHGDARAPFSAGASFTDDSSLAVRGSPWICGHCAALTTQEGLRQSGHGVFSEAGMRPFRKWADISAALIDPPQSPFVMVHATRNNQHMAWRAPVNFSRDLYYVRVGLSDLRIRRPVLQPAVLACARIAAYMGITATDKSLPHPFATLSPDLKESHTALRRRGPEKNSPNIEDAAQKLLDDFALLHSLSLGESWALRFLLTPGAGA
ncbi:MAG: type IV CRISPR-associated protein Csf1, partial [Acidobacteriaceae bacterium]